MQTKNEVVRDLVALGDYKSALLICKDWNYKDPSHREILRLGYECLVHPEFYRQLGRNTQEEYQKAVAVLKEVYGR